MTARARIQTTINKVLSPVGLKVARLDHDWNDQRQYIPLDQTLGDAAAAGLSVADYIDVTYNVAGATRHTIQEMENLGVFSGNVKSVVEIGPGSGRYLEKVVKLCGPSTYEIYEIAKPWADYLVKTYNVTAQSTDGGSMPHTRDASMDLVHAHKVFCSVSFLTSVRYWPEMIRCAKPRAHIVFDVMTESCLDDTTADAWAATAMDGSGTYPAVMPRSFVIEYFARHNVTLVGSFLVTMKPGKTETFVFRKSPAGALR